MKTSIIVATFQAASQSGTGFPSPSVAYSLYHYADMYQKWSFWQQLAAEGDPQGNDWFGRFTGWDLAGYPRPKPVTMVALFGQAYAPDNVSDLGLESGEGLHSDYTPPPWARYIAPSDPATQQSTEAQPA